MFGSASLWSCSQVNKSTRYVPSQPASRLQLGPLFAVDGSALLVQLTSVRITGTSGPGRLFADEALVRATRAGQSRASDVLVRRYYPSVLAYLIRQVGDPERAQDLAQEAFYTAFRTLLQLRAPHLFAAWLYRIVATTVAAAYRRQRRTPPTLSLDRLPTPPATPPPTDTRLLVSQTLATISRADRNLLIMDGIWGLTEREIAASLGLSRAAARKRLQRAKERFRARYAVGE